MPADFLTLSDSSLCTSRGEVVEPQGAAGEQAGAAAALGVAQDPEHRALRGGAHRCGADMARSNAPVASYSGSNHSHCLTTPTTLCHDQCDIFATRTS
jgi:hypothetical protein